ncbi:hypothetical protein [Nocardioides dongxiaopingii]|uniref:hypothetical protein n=1 Tax=Nocardioides dongxiaopingii TaxID=2576036 RepID=UPI0010C76D7F|nr:hypothetical protein [Nocardioides dongxiaopingii]
MTTTRRLLAVVAAAALGVTLAPASATPASASPTLATTASAAPASATPAAEPDEGEVGEWGVTALGDGRFTVSWTAPDVLPLNSDRPTISGAGLTFGPTTTAADGRTVRAVVTAEAAPDPADLDVVLSGDRLDEAGSDPAGPASGRPVAAPRATPLDAPDPGAAGPFPTVSSDYRLPGVRVPGMPQPIEMVGHVVEPAASAATGPRPLVVFLHGRHEVCYDPDDDDAYARRWPCRGRFEEIPSHLGYVYVQQLLASQGYATVSVRVNGINAQDGGLDDGGADARARIVREHLDHWTTLAAAHQVDLDQVVLVGHSRGGEGVDRASIEIPLSAPYRVAGQVLIAPTDFASHTAPYVPTATVLPYCDGDVFDIQGQKFTDTARDLATDDTSLKSSLLVMGANHNFFNTEWTPGTAVAPANDDWGADPDAACGRRAPDRLSARGQRDVGKAYVAAAVRLFTGDDAYLPLFDGSAVSVPSTGDAVVRSHALGGGRDVRRPGIEATPTLAGGGARTRICTGRVSEATGPVADCGSGIRRFVAPHWSSSYEPIPTRAFLELDWSRAGAVGGLRFDRPLDLTADRLALRTIVDPRRGPVDLQVRLTDGAGGTVTLDPDGGRRLAPLLDAGEATKLWAQAVLVDAAGATGIDLTDVRSVELVGRSTRGRVWVADVAAAPAVLAAVPATRAPQVSLGRLRIDEGDPPGRRTVRRIARVPFTITGDVTAPARMTVVTTGQTLESRQRFSVDVAPGQTSGTIPVPYLVDDVHGGGGPVQITAWPARNLATDVYQGSLTVRDDDPLPKVRVRLTRSVREGASVVLTVRLSAPLGDDLYPNLTVVRGPGPLLSGADVPAAWLRRVTPDGSCTQALHRCQINLGTRIRAGGTTARIVIPVRADARREGVERLTIRYASGVGRSRRATVVVRDR